MMLGICRGDVSYRDKPAFRVNLIKLEKFVAEIRKLWLPKVKTLREELNHSNIANSKNIIKRIDKIQADFV